MKRMMIFLLAVLMLLTAGCSIWQTKEPEPEVPEDIPVVPEAPKEESVEEPEEKPKDEPEEELEEEPKEEAEEEPVVPVPECTNAVVQADLAPAILTLLNRGDTVDVVGEHDEDHYIVKVEAGYGLMEKQLLRMGDEAAFEGWTGYATSNAALCSSYQLNGSVITNLNMNTNVEVLDELKYCYVVKVGEESGFMLKSEVSPYYIQYTGGSGSADGGDISLRSGWISNLSTVEQSGEVTGTAEVLADGAQVILGYFAREELAPVVAEEGFAPAWEGYYTLYLDGLYAYLPQKLALPEGELPYEPWSGFAGYNAAVYKSYLLLGDHQVVYVNTSITVLWDGGDFYIVSIGDEIGYLAKDQVGQTQYATGGGGGGGGDWTPPAM